MKSTLQFLQGRVVSTTSIAALFLLTLTTGRIDAAVKTWDGLGGDGRWATGNNWVGNVPPASGDLLIFAGTTRLSNTNNFVAGITFNGITIAGPGGFTLTGNSITNSGNLTNSQVVTIETINVPMVLSATSIVDVTTSGSLTLGGPISGQGGLTLVDGGTLTLTGGNTFAGRVSVNGGTLSVTNDVNLGAAPISNAPVLVINGGILATTTSFTNNANRGILLGPVSGAGSGTFDVSPFVRTLTIPGTIGNQGTNGGLIKQGFGGLTLAGTNSYTGPTIVTVGTLTLDFSRSSAPPVNIVNTNSALTVGGATAGVGTTNFAQLVMIPAAGAVNAQAFKSTLIDIGTAIIQGTSNNLGTANLALGRITHNVGGVAIFIPPNLVGGQGNITTTSTNVNGILGGFATISDGTIAGGIRPAVPTNWACVDVNGNIVNYSNYTVYSVGNLSSIMFKTNNIMIDASTAGDVNVAPDSAPGVTNTFDVNTISMNRPAAAAGASWSLRFGVNNIVRLGKFGAVFSQQRSTSTANTWEIGSGTLGGNGQQNVGTLTAGGPNANSSGEIVFIEDQTSSNSGANENVDVQIADNGTGTVTVVKAGPGYMKLRGHNTYSGGTYFLQGRLQFAGGDLGSANPDAVGTGSCFLFPGSYLFAPPAGFTNALAIAGSGSQQEQLGVIRGAGSTLGPITLIGDVTLGNATYIGPVSGPFNVTLGPLTTVNGTVMLSNTLNNWTGNTTMQARSTTGGNIIKNAADEVIPNGFGKGSVIMNSGTGGNTFVTWDLNGFNETINGLSSVGSASQARGGGNFIQNNRASSVSTLTVGDNDVSSTFAGYLAGKLDSQFTAIGTIALTKIGAGVLTITSTNSMAGPTTVNGGTLALSGVGSLPGSTPITVNTNATLDVSGVKAGFTAINNGTVTLNGGTLIGNTAPAGVNFLVISNGAGLTVSVNPNVTNIYATTLTTGGPTNFINILKVSGVSGYPSTFPIVKMVVPGISGSGSPVFGLGQVPSVVTVGYVTNNTGSDATAGFMDLVLLNGPKTLTWTGATNYNWDVATTTNWLAFGVTPVAFNTADSPLFTDTGSTSTVNVTTQILPGDVTVSNASKAYTFVGSGAIAGIASLIKQGTGTLVLANGDPLNELNDFKGGVTLSGGTLTFVADNNISGGLTASTGTVVRVGTNTATGSLPQGNAQIDGTLWISRTGNLTVNNSISGAGSLTNDGSGIITLSGNNSFTGAVVAASGTLQAGSATALGAVGPTNGAAYFTNSGAMLDVNGFNLGQKEIVVGGSGVTGQGAIVNNNGSPTFTARNVARVTLVGDTTFGGTGRWDLRSSTTTDTTGSSLTCSNSVGYNLTIVGPTTNSSVHIVGTTVDPALGNIDVQSGVLSLEVAITGLGDNTKSLTVRTGATLALFNVTSASALDKQFAFNGSGTNDTLLATSGVFPFNRIVGPATLSGNCIFDITGGNNVTFASAVTGGGSLTKIGSGSLTLGNGVNAGSYTGTTLVTNGTLYLDGPFGNSSIVVTNTGTLSGFATVSGSVVVNSGPGVGQTAGITPGDPSLANEPVLRLNGGSLTLINSSNSFVLLQNPGIPANDNFAGNAGIDVAFGNGGLTMGGTNVFNIQVASFQVVGQKYALITYGGTPLPTSVTNNIVIVAQPGYAYNVLDPQTTANVGGSGVNALEIQVTRAIGADFWFGGSAGGNGTNAWDQNVTANWFKNFAPGARYTNTDLVFFDESGQTFDANALATINMIDPDTNGLRPGRVTFSNSVHTYKFVGSGHLSGTNDFIRANGGAGGLVILANTGSNDFSGTITMNAGTVQIGDGTTVGAGTFGWGGAIDMNPATQPSLIYTRPDDLLQSNNINGGGFIWKSNANTLTLLGSGNTFTGQVNVVAGMLQLGNGSPLGESNACFISVSNGATLGVGYDIVAGTNLLQLGANSIEIAQPVVVGGTGVGGKGAIVNNSAVSQHSAFFGGLILTADTTFGGRDQTNAFLAVGDNGGRWDLRSTSTNGVLSTGGQPFKITKIGSNQVSLVAIQVDGALGDIDVQQGIMGFETSTTSMGNPSSNLIVHAGAMIEFFNSVTQWDKTISLTGNGFNPSVWGASGSDPLNTIIGPVTLNGPVVMWMNSGSMTFSNTATGINGSGELIKAGGATLNLAGVNAWTGNTTISNGTLALFGNSTIANSPVIKMQTSSSKLDLSPKSDNTLTLGGSQVLQGIGTIDGDLTVAGGTEVRPGVHDTTNGLSVAGALNVTTNVTLSGNTFVYIDKSANGYGQILGAQSITYGGSLMVTNLSESTNALANGDYFKLFGATSYSGAGTMTLNLQALQAGYYWQTNTLNADGTIRVLSLVTNTPHITGNVLLNGTNLVLTGGNGIPNGIFYVIGTNNITAPRTAWTRLATNRFDGLGNFNVTNVVSGASRQFVTVIVPY